jgi:hypothetical protein
MLAVTRQTGLGSQNRARGYDSSNSAQTSQKADRHQIPKLVHWVCWPTEDWQIQFRSFHLQLDVVHIRRNFDPVYLFDVSQSRCENIVINRQSKEISEDAFQGFVSQNVQIDRSKKRSIHILGSSSPPLVRANVTTR